MSHSTLEGGKLDENITKTATICASTQTGTQLAPEPEKSHFSDFRLLQDQSSRYRQQLRDLGQTDNVLCRYYTMILW